MVLVSLILPSPAYSIDRSQYNDLSQKAIAPQSLGAAAAAAGTIAGVLMGPSTC
jgi:hypothetical protein